MAYGFKEQNGNYCMPIAIRDELAHALDDIAIELEGRLEGKDLSLTPVYRTSDENRVYARVVRPEEGILFSNIYNKSGAVAKPEDKVGVVMCVRAVIRVDSVFFGDRPKIQISLVEAEVENAEIQMEKLL